MRSRAWTSASPRWSSIRSAARSTPTATAGRRRSRRSPRRTRSTDASARSSAARWAGPGKAVTSILRSGSVAELPALLQPLLELSPQRVEIRALLDREEAPAHAVARHAQRLEREQRASLSVEDRAGLARDRLELDRRAVVDLLLHQVLLELDLA